MAKLSRDELNKAHGELRNDARQRIADRGILQFRADNETVLAVLDAADKHKMPVSTLLRQWIQEKLMLETTKEKAPNLVQRVIILEEAVIDLQQKLNQ
jgi:hypothetical protein